MTTCAGKRDALSEVALISVSYKAAGGPGLFHRAYASASATTSTFKLAETFLCTLTVAV